MEFRTQISPQESASKIQLSSRIFTIGSCFSDEIGSRLLNHKFDVLNNPFGTIYNPVSISSLLTNSINNFPFSQDRFVESQGVHYSYDFHSRISALSESELTEVSSAALQESHEFLTESEWILITLGTAVVYRLKDSNEIVANCHKVPSDSFSKEILSISEIKNSLVSWLEQASDKNIILTVSPVRHIRDTLEINSVSKSILRVVSHELSEEFQNVHYFPSYEILMDDLRDYRFYADDLIHPSSSASEYVWKKFTDAFMDKETLDFVHQWQKLSQSIRHKPFQTATPQYKLFLEKTINKLELLSGKVDTTEEIRTLKTRLNEIEEQAG